ncbi:beta-1,3-glucan-binding protein [Lingula anatina]|uniref:Beta-1,3-glucan-binding protein n=1 Tax=Lingula anatina TaxID=7574 RepID=A0A1S3HGN3_LINAN|nr:beta-1,3-glucan-binding protein [Lingula anatina]|eukprot:XP_013384636.1 beta-1,3-glucan-binding protein [Lingula anatina]
MQGSWSFLCVLLITSVTKNNAVENLIFEDTFDTLDPKNWEHEITAWGGGNWEFEVYTNDSKNSYVRDNTLYIKPTLLKDSINPLTGQPFGESFLYNGTLDIRAMYGRCTNEMFYGCLRRGQDGQIVNPIMSARVRTKGKFSFKYGRLEVVAKMPAGDWIWPAIWLLPEDNEYGEWPRSGEIDLVEARGNRDLYGVNKSELGVNAFASALHWGPIYNDNKFHLTDKTYTNKTANFADNFHKYVVDWSANGFRFSVDGHQFLEIPSPLLDENPSFPGFWAWGNQSDGGWKNQTQPNPWKDGTRLAPFDKAFHIIMNVAVGGTMGYFPDSLRDGSGNITKPWSNSDSKASATFWEAKDRWYPTWTAEGEGVAMQVKSVRVYQTEEESGTTMKTPDSSSGTILRMYSCSLLAVLFLMILAVRHF